MKHLTATALMLGLMLAQTASAANDYMFNCKNEWMQERMIEVTAESINEARKILKTDKEIMTKYSLNRQSMCAFRSDLGPSKKTKTAQKNDGDTPTE